MKKLISLMASASLFTLFACSADGVMDGSSEHQTVADKTVAEAEAQRTASESSNAKSGNLCSVQENGKYVSFTIDMTGYEEFIGDFCEMYEDVKEDVENFMCDDAKKIVSFDYPLPNGQTFDAMSGEANEFCDELEDTLESEFSKNSDDKDDFDEDDFDEDDFDEDDFDDYDFDEDDFWED